jgi:exonuclease III
LKYKLIFTLSFLAMLIACDAQHKPAVNTIKQKQADVYPVAFYNLENLFDTYNDPNTDDDEFTPDGLNRYTDKVYQEKLNNMAYAIQRIGTDKNPDGVALIGLAEVENDKVLNDLINQPSLKGRGYRYEWYNSTDPRGIDVALLYNPAYFTVLQSKKLPFEWARDVLYVTGTIGKDTVHVLVNHWPSRRDGKDETEHRRKEVAAINRQQIDQIRSKNPNAKIVVMGDLNDNPTDESIAEVLNAHEAIDDNTALYNPMAAMYAAGKGTAIFKHTWDMFDQLILSQGLANGNGLHYDSAEVYDRPFLRQEKGKFKNYPFRSFRGTYWNHGYSDHFPVVMYLKK